MISRGSWRLSRKCANGKRRRRLAPRPQTTYKKPAGAAPRPPAARDLEGAGGAPAGSPARGGGRGRCPGALAPVAHLARRRQPGWRRGLPGPGGGAAGSPPAAALGSREGSSGPAPEAISFCASHMKAASRAPGPRCRRRRRRGERELHCAAPSGPPPSPSPPRAPRAAQRRPPRPCPRRASLPRSLRGWLARSLARCPPPRPGALESAEFAEREPFKFSALGCLERGLLAGKQDGGEREEGTRRGPERGAPRTPSPLGTQARGSGERMCVFVFCVLFFFLPETGPGPRLPSPDQQLVLVLRREPLFCSPRGGGAGVGRACSCGSASLR